ncbi:MAG: HAD-IA family hydrolase [Pseudomonadota bacterium]
MQALLFGAIGTLVETSELQRRAFNAAFAEANLEWAWNRATYADLLQTSGGEKRISEALRRAGLAIDAANIHRRKTELFHEILAQERPGPRPGVADIVAAAPSAGVRLGFVTTTSRDNVDAILGASGIPADTFDFIGDASMVASPKPAPDIYNLALARLGAKHAVAIEDSPDGANAARAAGLQVVAFPGVMHVGRDFGDVLFQTQHLDPSSLLGLL